MAAEPASSISSDNGGGTFDETKRQNYPWGRSKLHANEPFVSLLTRGDFKYGIAKEGGLFANKLGTFAYQDTLGESFGSQWISRTEKNRQRKGGNNQRNKKQKLTEAGSEEVELELASQDQDKLAVPPKVHARIHVIPCTPEVWCRSLLHRTQIIYSLDASLICFHLDLTPGKVVCESGTGSGSLSFAMSRAIAPNGHVNTFEFNENRVAAAQADFKMLGVDELITVRRGDALSMDGFLEVAGQCDAVFLDLPQPWKAMANCIRALKPDVETRLCSFSPCIEQVQRTCDAMRANGFFQIRTFECVFREFETYRLQERIPKMWEDTTNGNQIKHTFNPAIKSGATSVFPDMATHTGYLTFCTRFPHVSQRPSANILLPL